MSQILYLSEENVESVLVMDDAIEVAERACEELYAGMYGLIFETYLFHYFFPL